MNSKTELELLNGSWMILSLSLSIICAVYLRHEILARRGAWRPLTWRKHFTRGMSVATAVMLMAIGICIRSAAVFLCFCTRGPSIQPFLADCRRPCFGRRLHLHSAGNIPSSVR